MSTLETLIVWDWNGTLLADSALCHKAANKVLEHFGLPAVTLAQYRHNWHMPLDRMYLALGITEAQLSQHESVVHDIWHAAYDALAKTARLRRGGRAVLEQLAHEHTMVILSNHTVSDIRNHMARLGVHRNFAAILANPANGGAFHKRGKGDRLRHYLGGHRPRWGAIIGDTIEEIDIGREVGLTTIAIADGVCSTARLNAARPDYLIRSLHELPALLRAASDATTVRNEVA